MGETSFTCSSIKALAQPPFTGFRRCIGTPDGIAFCVRYPEKATRNIGAPDRGLVMTEPEGTAGEGRSVARALIFSPGTSSAEAPGVEEIHGLGSLDPHVPDQVSPVSELESMRAEIAAFREQSRIDREQQSTDRETNRLTQQKMQDLEDENTALARALDRRHQHNEALTQALARASQPATGVNAAQRVIQVPVELFPESLRHLPPPPLPQPVPNIPPVTDANTALLV
ncbi:uncharacterized protein LOC133706592 [Rosa rugosa]|uniref:uncharacterized protein LOC133706592 n=1 Tax=Rosa rugosa TaxID=74645 RepID=UPI002B400FC1|nr:uncharacterized protein LOC133706592 [Rosa rugosa]